MQKYHPTLHLADARLCFPDPGERVHDIEKGSCHSPQGNPDVSPLISSPGPPKELQPSPEYKTLKLMRNLRRHEPEAFPYRNLPQVSYVSPLTV